MGNGAAQENINVIQGETFSIFKTWLFPTDPDDPRSEFTIPQNLTGCSGLLTAKDRNGVELFSVACTLGDTDGTIEAEILDTSSWPIGSYRFTLMITFADGSRDAILVGDICVRP